MKAHELYNIMVISGPATRTTAKNFFKKLANKGCIHMQPGNDKSVKNGTDWVTRMSPYRLEAILHSAKLGPDHFDLTIELELRGEMPAGIKPGRYEFVFQEGAVCWGPPRGMFEDIDLDGKCLRKWKKVPHL